MSIFKDYKKYSDFSCDKAGKVYVNVCGSYSYNDKNTNGIFGKGFRLSIFSRLEHVSNDSITLYNIVNGGFWWKRKLLAF